ncbi:MAG: YihY/virulence factor BrkB family protein [Bacteroidetes bacterium]|nr:YihY/virulence factor BrkB family protein [Rhodothermia bacterium]MCS7154264.1 YihY/virulence factor BrkB family protein [Bacteroidota bacterium]MCX7906700.1 YihY/virulence factor BrkB family protein [Bacteroidota bacterium]MDW8137020.1 YihY/virulence factor BrkB family protein [Bacteroidota bacterium]MDW8285109.1 YihY/virulence factor BrkB family protein [Bacteroidota bacterium]
MKKNRPTQPHQAQGRWGVFGRACWDLLRHGHPFYMAAALAFSLGLSTLPLLLFAIAGLGFFLSSSEAAHARVRELLEAYLPALERFSSDPELTRQHLEGLLLSLIEGRGIASGLAAGALFLAGSSLAASLRTTVHLVFGLPERRNPVMSKLYDLLWFGLLGSAVVFTGTLGTLWGILWRPLQPLLEAYGVGSILVTGSGLVGPVGSALASLLNAVVFALLFRYLPEVRLPWSTAWVGSVAFTLLLELAKYAIGFYLAHSFARLNALYGSYALLSLLALWCYYVALMFVLSATIAHAYQRSSRSRSRSASG